MDKKNFIIGIICLFAAFSLFVRQEKQLRQQAPQQPVAVVQNESPTPQPEPALVLPQQDLTTSQIYTLENEAVKVHFTTRGGAIHSIELKRYPAELKGEQAYIFNQTSKIPALGLAWDKNHLILNNFVLSAQTNDFIQFSCTLNDGTQIIRGYRLANSNDENPYRIQNEFLIQQPEFKHESVWVHLGTMPDTPGDKYLEYLNFCTFDGKTADFKRIADFEASNGFLGMGKKTASNYLEANANFTWCALKNQFFAAIFTPKTSINGYLTFPRKGTSANESHLIEGLIKFDLNSAQSKVTAEYYVGPKDFLLLNKMGQEQDQLMQFGFFGAVSKILLMAMKAIYSVIPNWGWTIIVLTFIIKLLMWPITQAQLRSSKKMASIQAPLQQIREKYKNNPQKLQMETMKLFKENRVNPAAGCLPIFLQIPIFIGLYYMLRTSSEIRFQSFLWIQDLSIPDTVASLGSFPINILPLIMGVTMFIQMRITPTPSVDNMQQKIIMWMPFIFLIFCYNFPAALVLYWTVQNIFTILQQWLTNRKKELDQPALKHS